MSLRDQLDAQERARDEMEEVLNSLAAEFAEQMVAFGVSPLPVMDTTGEHTTEDLGVIGWNIAPTVIKTVHCRPSGVEAWSLESSSMGKALFGQDFRILAITTDGKLLVTERRDDGAGHGVRLKIEGIKAHYVLVPYDLYDIYAAPSWDPMRDRDAHNILIDWAERAHVEGVEAITEPIELAMLHVVNGLNKKR